LKSKEDQFELKTLNGIIFPELNYEDIKRGILDGKFLSVDFVKSNFKPWMKLKDSEFGSFFKTGSEKVNSNKSSVWIWFFCLSLGVNMLLLFFIYLQKLKIDSLLGN